MSSDRRSRVREVFEAASRHSEEDRLRFVEEACGEDQDLRREVESLLLERDRLAVESGESIEETDLLDDSFRSGDAEVSDGGAEDRPASIGRYRIVSILGEGGMGRVYEAEDPELKRRVALKVLTPKLATDAKFLSRFKREAQTVAALSHPNVVTLYSVEDSDGTHFLTMELVRGEPLHHLIPEGGFDLKELLDKAIPLVEGLRAAHEAGIVHRDLKPGNVMVDTEGRVRILDFGLAKQHTADPTDSQEETMTALTAQGAIVGTVPYMSPEQVSGQAVDQRSDIFSLGIILYEMGVGQRPFRGETATHTMSAILRDQPPRLTEARHDLPEHLERIIRRCLEKEPAKRYQTALLVKEELEALKREVELGQTQWQSGAARSPNLSRKRILLAAIGSIALVVALFLLNGLISRPAKEPGTGQAFNQAAERTMIAILPLRNLGAPGDEYFAAGMTDELSSRLATVSGLGVISSESTQEYADTTKPTRQIGEELGVEYLVSGTVRWARGKDESSRVRISPKLIQVADDTQIWSKIYDRRLDDIFAVQTEIAQSVVLNLRTTLLDTEEAGLAKQPTDNLEAYQAYLRGSNFGLRSREHLCHELERVVEELELATRLDTEFAKAWADLSRRHSQLYTHCLDATEERKGKVVLALQQAKRLAPRATETLEAAGLYLLQIEKDYHGALELVDSFEGRVEQSAELSAGQGYALRRLGRWDEAIESLRRAFRLNPRRVSLAGSIAFASTYRRAYSDAIKTFDTAIAMRPHDTDYLLRKAVTYWLWRGDLEASRKVLNSADGQDELHWAWYWQEIYEGRYHEAVERAGSFTRDWLSTELYHWPVDLYKAIAHDLLGEEVQAQVAFDTARLMIEAKMKSSPNEAKLHRALSVALAGLGRKQQAIVEAKKATAIYPIEEHPYFGSTDLKNLAQVLTMVGDFDDAFEALDTLLAMPSLVSIPLLEVDPRWAPLRSDPRFAELKAKYGKNYDGR